MNLKLEKVSVGGRSFQNLPIAHSLRAYKKENWICFGGLTHRNPTVISTQVDNFKTLMDTLGGPNHCFGKRLHWFLRTETGIGSTDHHIHFLLGGHKVTDGHFRPFKISEVCDFLRANWTHGICFIEPFQSGLDGVGYVTKITKNTDRDDHFELSDALTKQLRRVAV